MQHVEVDLFEGTFCRRDAVYVGFGFKLYLSAYLAIGGFEGGGSGVFDHMSKTIEFKKGFEVVFGGMAQ